MNRTIPVEIIRGASARTPVEGELRPSQPALRTIDSRTLFHGEHEIGIEHEGSLYRLKITRQGKLILNK